MTKIVQTEIVADAHENLFEKETDFILNTLIDDQYCAVKAVQAISKEMAVAVDKASSRLMLHKEGRIGYAGAGTSGRLAVGDAVELTPTFGWQPQRILSLIAGGNAATRQEMSKAEDNEEEAVEAIETAQVSEADVIIGAAASGNTPYTCRILEEAKTRGALTIGLSNSAEGRILSSAEYGFILDTGSEVLAGSTRLSAGTSQKIFFNSFSTALMMQLGLVYKGRMIAMRPTNEKLKKRAATIISDLSPVTLNKAANLLIQADNHLPTAILMANGASLTQAKWALEESKDHFPHAMQRLKADQ